MTIKIPDLSLVVLVGASGSGKSSFAHNHFLPTEILSSDTFRGLVSDDENSMDATSDAFEMLHTLLRLRLARGRLCVVDATNVQPGPRKALIQIARAYHVVPVAIVLNTPVEVCIARNKDRADRNFGPHVCRAHVSDLKRSLRSLQVEGFRYVHVLSSPDEVENAEIVREPLWTNRKNEHGPFDIVGDLHGCFDELHDLLGQLGYQVERLEEPEDDRWFKVCNPVGHKLVLLGDLVDRGPKSTDVLKLAMQMVRDDQAIVVPGNHDEKLLRKLTGRSVQVAHGMEETLEQLAKETPEFSEQVREFLDSLVSHFVLDGGKLVVAHAGMREEYQGRASMTVRDFALFGETTGEKDEFGLPVRYNWATEYRGKAKVIYGHTPVFEPEWLNGTLNVDTGCVFGGKLTALQYPTMRLVSVEARETYVESPKPLLGSERSLQHENDDLLDLEDVLGKRIIATAVFPAITIREENAITALEVMSRFAANPKWLTYLPPTMSPTETSQREDYLEYPDEAFAYYRKEGISQVVCEQKHMGSRSVVVLCRDEEVAKERFGIEGEGSGIVVTRTGRRFFEDREMERGLIRRLIDAATSTGLWDKLDSPWVVLDCELMPWSVKAQELLKQQYAAVGASATASTTGALAVMNAAGDVPGLDELRNKLEQSHENADRFVAAYRQYCWSVTSLDDIKLAPFHVLASEGKVHADRDHIWHMETIASLCDGDPGLLIKTPYRLVDLANEEACAAAAQWWEELTASGGEGMVVKPFDFVARSGRGLIQPAVKCRGREYLRIIYGPDYTRPENLVRLKKRGLGRKRSLALREFALGLESLLRFVRREPLRKVHECVFGVLALESEPVDPRL